MWGATDMAFILWCVLRVPGVPLLAQLRIVATVIDAHVSTCASAFLSTFAMPLLALLRPGYYATPLGSLLLTVHVNSIYALLFITFCTGAVYEWYAGEMVRVCKRGPGASQELPVFYPYTRGASAVGEGGGEAGSAAAGSGGSSSSSSSSAQPLGAAGAAAMQPSALASAASADSLDGAAAAAAAAAVAATAGAAALGAAAAPSASAAASAVSAAGSITLPGSSSSSSSSGGASALSPLNLSHVVSLSESRGLLAQDSSSRGGSANLAVGTLPSADRTLLGRLRSGAITWLSASDYMLKMLPWVWAPITAVVYMLGPAAMAQTKLMCQNRMRKAHVSPKSSPTPVATPRPGAATPNSLSTSSGGGGTGESPTQMQQVIQALEAFAPGARIAKMQLPAALSFGRRSED